MILNLFGPSGSGKTTFINYLLATNNTHNFYEKFINKKFNKDLNKQISVSLMPLPKFRGSVNEFFQIFSIEIDSLIFLKNELKELSDTIFEGISDNKSLIKVANRQIETFSAGELRRLFLLKSLLLKSNMTIIDEPFSNSDEKLWDIISQSIYVSQQAIVLSHFPLKKYFREDKRSISINIKQAKNFFNI